MMDLDLERIRNAMKGRDGGCTYSEANLLINEIERLRADRDEWQSKAHYHNNDALKMQGRSAELEIALLKHRWDLHEYSKRPCPTCRESAGVLGIKVPDTCARESSDTVALAALKGEG